METIFDLALTLDENSVIRRVQTPSGAPLPPSMAEAASWIGMTCSQIPETQWDLDAGVLHWKKRRFTLSRFVPEEGFPYLLLRSENTRDRLMEDALNLIPDAIQLYDADGRILFFNRTCKKLLDIPEQADFEGRSLLDLFLVDPEYSTTLTTLRTHSPVVGRFDVYKSTTGKDLSTVNTSLPIIRDGVLCGAMTIERDLQTTEHILSVYQRVHQTLVRSLSLSLNVPKTTRYTFDDLIGSDTNLLLAKDIASRMAAKDVNILIQGETGTGKEIFAQSIHALSSRRKERFVAVNCAAFPESLIESMLFGTVKGAFTGSTDKAGLIEDANHGTLFLDEINSMSLAMQAKLLRVLQEKTLQRIGSTKNIPVDIRVLSSCNEDAFALSENGKLRRDLFYRLASVVIEIPPLRERTSDLDELVSHYIRKHSPPGSPSSISVTPAFRESLYRHSWPGNVRELFHILDYVLSVCEDGVLRVENLPVYFFQHSTPAKNPPPSLPVPPGSPVPPDSPDRAAADLTRGLSVLIREYERNIVEQAYLASGKNATQAAETLHLSRQSYQYYLKKHHIKE